jgi:hypothetical protein
VKSRCGRRPHGRGEIGISARQNATTGSRADNRSSGKDVAIGHRRSGKPVLIEIEPGSYSLRRIDTAYVNVDSVRIPEPELYFELQPGRVNYIGDLLIALIDGPRPSVAWDFAPSDETLHEAAALHPEPFREPPLWLQPGVPPVPIVLEREASPAPAGASN